MKTKITRLVCFWILGGMLLYAGNSMSQASGNPILPGYQADPDIQFYNGKYYIYPTSQGGSQFHAWSSTDLTNWVDEGIIFDVGPDCSWGNTNGWAPTVVFRNNQYYFYYSASSNNDVNARNIGVAYGPTPIGPFTDKGSPLIANPDFNSIEIIDPAVFIDSNGDAYIYYGGSHTHKMNIRRLNPNMTSFDPTFTPVEITPLNYSEAPHMMKRNGIYYLSYSSGIFSNGTYNVQYSTASTPIGPWTYQGSVLPPNSGSFSGSGHHAIVKRPGCDEYYIAYHRYEFGNYNTRKVAIDRLYFDSNNKIMEVDQTFAGVPARPASAGCITPNPISNGVYWIQSRLNSPANQPLVLEITGCNQGAGANVATWTANTSCLNQRWQLTYADNFYKIVSAEPAHLALDLTSCGQGLGTNIAVWNNMPNDCQLWRIEASSTPGYFRIMSKESGYVADIFNNSNVAGADIAAYEWYGQNNQIWKFSSTLPVSGSPVILESPEETKTKFVAYPNPVNSELTINVNSIAAAGDLATEKELFIKLYSVNGTLVKLIKKNKGAALAKIDTRNMINGTYFLQVLDNGKTVHKQQIQIRHK